jgi:TatA/E family protein of Tat protein translocase
MPGLGHWWILLILAGIALIIFGPSRLPELGSGLGKAIKEFRKATSEMGDALKEEVRQPDQNTPTAVGTTYPASPPAGTEPGTPPAPAPTTPAPPAEPPKA